MSIDEVVMPNEHDTAGVTRRPSPKLKGTRIIGDIMSPVVPEKDWDALK